MIDIHWYIYIVLFCLGFVIFKNNNYKVTKKQDIIYSEKKTTL